MLTTYLLDDLTFYYLKHGNTTQPGVFSGVDNENRLVNGTLTINYSND